MDGFCLQGELDLTLFYKIEGYFDNLKSLMTENDRTLWGVKMISFLGACFPDEGLHSVADAFSLFFCNNVRRTGISHRLDK